MKNLNLAISPAKADRLYWLGRYAERAVLSLHLLRKYCNVNIDADSEKPLEMFASLMGVPTTALADGSFVHDYLYSDANVCSIASILAAAKNNAMLERNDIKTETLAYIELAVNILAKAKVNKCGVFALQPISDYLMSFWGAVDENVRSRPVRNLLAIGRYVERLDIMIRFGYDPDRIADVLSRLESIDESELALCDPDTLAFIRSKVGDPASSETLARLNALFAA